MSEKCLNCGERPRTEDYYYCAECLKAEGAAPTPGPWRYRNHKNAKGALSRDITGNHYKNEDGEVMTSVAVVLGNATSQIVTEANARLIAAAPELLAACKEAMLDVRNSNVHQMLRLAVAKAEGR